MQEFWQPRDATFPQLQLPDSLRNLSRILVQNGQLSGTSSYTENRSEAGTM